MELKDIVYIDFKAIQNHAMLEVWIHGSLEFKDNKPTKMFVVTKFIYYFRGRILWVFDCSWVLTEYRKAQTDAQIFAWVYEEVSQVYTQLNKYGLQFKLVGLSLIEEE